MASKRRERKCNMGMLFVQNDIHKQSQPKKTYGGSSSTKNMDLWILFPDIRGSLLFEKSYGYSWFRSQPPSKIQRSITRRLRFSK